MISDLVIIGGGASGFMAAVTATLNGLESVSILESTPKVLEKVRISGGGRCNITNSCREISNLINNYPRGDKELIGLFNRFSTNEAFEWFQAQGLELKIEHDGRVFPRSDSSNDVIKCLTDLARNLGVKVFTDSHVKQVTISDYGFNLHVGKGRTFHAKKILISTGGHPSGRKLAKSLGHSIVKPVPSLFSFCVHNNSLAVCSGISLNVQIKLIVNNNIYTEKGTILITHRGFSGPAILRLSAFSARTLNANNYSAKLKINWLCMNEDKVRSIINYFKIENGRKLVLKSSPFNYLPKSLWEAILLTVNISNRLKWSDLSKSDKGSIVKCLTNNSYLIKSRGPYGEEFVTAGGVSLPEVDFKTMESKICKGLFFAGEILNIDGITGGFNFQHCWTSGWVAGQALSIF